MRRLSWKPSISHLASPFQGGVRSWTSVIDDGLRSELRKTVSDPQNRAAVYAMLEKAKGRGGHRRWELPSLSSLEDDPFIAVEGDIRRMQDGIVGLVSNRHPVLSVVARYYFATPGKRFRPTVVLLAGRACGNADDSHVELAQIVEMIHTASLTHDDVLDEATQRRGRESINWKYGNKMAVLVGDFLLARASMALAGLRDHEVTALLSQMIAELVEGEFVQIRPQQKPSMQLYLRKTYLKTASMLRSAARAAALLCNPRNENAVEAMSTYGEALGMAFQIIDDVLDVESSSSGKDAMQDLKAGLVTAPLLLAAEEMPMLQEVFARGMSAPDDIKICEQALRETNGLLRAKQLAFQYVDDAKKSLQVLPPSRARHLLEVLADRVVNRKS